MFKVKIYDLDEDTEFFTEMPYLPNKGDQIGSYVSGGEWESKSVKYFAHDFNKKGKFDYTEICISND